MVSLGGVWSTQYYDDYPNVEVSLIAENSRAFMEFVLKLLGWRFASSGKRAEPPSEKFKVLGVELDFSGSCSGSFVVANKADRVSDLVSLLGDIVKNERLTSSEASSLHGQLNFAQGQYYGCSLKPAMVFLQRVMKLGWQSQFRDELILMATYLVTALRTCPPRTIAVADCKVPLMVYTDGAYEPGQGHLADSAGLVIADFLTGFRVVQAVEVSQELLEHWGRNGSKQLIAYLELWPVLVCLYQYGMQFFGRRAIFFHWQQLGAWCFDQTVVAQCWYVFYAGTQFAADIKTLSSCGFTHIASASNPADAPSRNQASDMASKLGAHLEQPIAVPAELSSAILARRSFVEFMKNAEWWFIHTWCSRLNSGVVVVQTAVVVKTEQGHDDMR